MSLERLKLTTAVMSMGLDTKVGGGPPAAVEPANGLLCGIDARTSDIHANGSGVAANLALRRQGRDAGPFI
jgi:hypothetical protein